MVVASDADDRGAPSRYREIHPLASGGMAELHLARVSGLGGFERLVVVKRLHARLADAPDRVQMLLDEARIAATLQHGNIVAVHDVAIENGSVSIVMEYLHGQDVRVLLKRAAQVGGGLVPLDQAIAIVLGVCAGLHHAHEQVDAAGKPLEIVHRDVSADNVFVTYDGGVKLIDFGIARARSRLGHTEHGVIKGKPGYMAPEQIKCLAVDRRADVHAAAVLLYELTCGTRPRKGKTDIEQYAATVDRDAIPPHTVRPGYPAALEEIVLRGLARDPAARYQTAAELGRALEQFARAQRLDLSNFGLANLMEELFRDKLEAWRAAQKAGRSLADHVAALRMTAASDGPAADARAAVAAAGTRGATPVPATPATSRRGLYLVLTVVGVALAIGGVVYWKGRTSGAPTTSDPPGSAPVAVPAPDAAVPAPDAAVPDAAAAPDAATVPVPDAVPAPVPVPDAVPTTVRSKVKPPKPPKNTKKPPSTRPPDDDTLPPVDPDALDPR
jgi:hypothetical protein